MGVLKRGLKGGFKGRFKKGLKGGLKGDLLNPAPPAETSKVSGFV